MSDDSKANQADQYILYILYGLIVLTKIEHIERSFQMMVTLLPDQPESKKIVTHR